MDFWLNEESLAITGEDLTPRLSAEFDSKPSPLAPGVSDELTALLTAMPAHSRNDVVRNGGGAARARKRSDNDSNYASDPALKEEEGIFERQLTCSDATSFQFPPIRPMKNRCRQQ